MRNLRKISVLLCILLFTSRCTHDDSYTIMNIELSEKGMKQPLSNYEVCIYEAKNPIFSMRQFHKLDCDDSENSEIISFKVKKNGHYSIEITGDNGFYHFNDFIRVRDFEKIMIFNFIYTKEDVEVLLYFDKKWVN
jgi:hypothetical protein